MHDGVSKPFFEALFKTFAREAGAGRDRTILLVLDNAGWHGEAGLEVPDGVRLIFLLPYTPELQPAETLWELVDEPLINKHIATIEALEDILANRCRSLAEQRTTIKSRTGFHWWPKIAVSKQSAGDGITRVDAGQALANGLRIAACKLPTRIHGVLGRDIELCLDRGSVIDGPGMSKGNYVLACAGIGIAMPTNG